MKSFNKFSISVSISVYLNYDFIFLSKGPIMNNSYTVYDGHNGQVSTSTHRCNKSSNKTVQRVFIRENEREVK